MKKMTSFSIFFILSFLSLSLASQISITIINNEEKLEPQTNWRSHDEVMGLYESWLVEHGKTYNSIGEKSKRFEIFKDNLRYIDDQNSIANRTYKLGLNKFVDLTHDEYLSKYSGSCWTPPVEGEKRISDQYLRSDTDTLPISIDWREKGAVNPIKYQGDKWSCWAFSTVASLEAINAIVTGDLVSLSEQELVDCDTSNHGCSGGNMEDAFKYVIKNGGIDTEKDYPYKAQAGTCDLNKKAVVTINGYLNVPGCNEKALQNAVAHQVVSVAIDDSSPNFKFYKSGIYKGDCGTSLGHAVNVVGYGVENDLEYWIVRNSWGTKWGEDGYVRMQRNVKDTAGLCGIAKYPSYPTKTASKSPLLRTKGIPLFIKDKRSNTSKPFHLLAL
ncbi:hypothetical protein M9H77_19986 [Catharanthus roseus]|uniref:Uncharacterized protein n=1 Tax=Catharanthus roseus TaxID=4058 RepID=A0ACC0AL10_CATRO|nr:hypothetical protein M9H77_19986 [Catharanthus roseus]